MSDSVWIIEFRGKGSASAERWYPHSGFCGPTEMIANTQLEDYERLAPKFEYRAVEYVRKEKP